MILRLRRLSTKYALLFAALLLLFTFIVLGLSGYFVLQRTNELRADLLQSFSSVRTSNDIEALRRSGTYLSNRLFNPLFNIDVFNLNEEVKQISSWLDPTSILILDRERRVVTDGSLENRDYGREIEIPAEFEPGKPLVEPFNGSNRLYFSIGYGDEIAGYARVELSNDRFRRLSIELTSQVAEAWKSYQKGFLLIALIGVGLVTIIGVWVGWRLSNSLSRPLREMTDAAEHYAAGELDHRLQERTRDELGRLARSLNKMAGDLNKAGKLLDRAQEMAAFGYWEWRQDKQELRLSYGVYKILGVDRDAFMPGVPELREFIFPNRQARVFSILQGDFRETVSAEFNIRRADGETRTLFIRGEPDQDATGGIIGSHGTIQDISKQKRSHAQLQQLANYDNLTGLPNRNLFYERLNRAITRAQRRQNEFALLFLDLDRFKSVNDALGHDVGDQLLQLVAQRLRSVVRGSDTLARMGGDEFTLIVEDLSEHFSPQNVAQNIIRAMKPAFGIAQRELFISTSIGIALYPKDATDVDTLIKNADAAMYLAKEQGKAVFRFFTPDLDRVAHERLMLESQLQKAIEHDEFELHYQPQVSSDSGETLALEALLRWRRGDEYLAAAHFVPVLEETGLIKQLTGKVLCEACNALVRLQRDGGPHLRMCVNLSAAQFQQADLTKLIEEALSDAGVSPEQLELEITETTLLDPGLSQSNAAELAARGIRLAIDDFGTGYSSLTYLQQFDVDALKIDRSFVRDLCTDVNDAQITETLLGLAKNLGIDAIAEGVEDEEQLQWLRDHGCDLVQGFLRCPPLPIDELRTWMASQSSALSAAGPDERV